MIIRINIGLCGYNYIVYLSLNALTFSSSESFQHVFVCGTIWPSIQSASWLCETFREPHGSPSSFSFHGGQGDNHAACDAAQCARSEATKEKAYMHTSTACHIAEYYASIGLLLWRIHGNFHSYQVHANSQFNHLRKQQFNLKVSHVKLNSNLSPFCLCTNLYTSGISTWHESMSKYIWWSITIYATIYMFIQLYLYLVKKLRNSSKLSTIFYF